jgi:hypothetical protein
MTDALATKPTDADTAALMERVVIEGDLSKLTPGDCVKYYVAVCRSVGLNPLTKPFEFLYLQNKKTLYARREATDQLRVIHGVKVTKLERELTDGIYTVTAYGVNRTGRTDAAMGAVAVEALRGLDKANAMMKAETKAKRRLTLSLCGLGLLDESEVDKPAEAVQATEVMQVATADGKAAEVPVATLFTNPEDDRKALVQRARIAGARLDKKRVAKLKETWLGSPDAEYEKVDLGALVSLVRDLEGEKL